jgi:hypothetical protein
LFFIRISTTLLTSVDLLCSLEICCTGSSVENLTQMYNKLNSQAFSHITYRTFRWVLETISFNCQICLTPDEQIIKYCVRVCVLKLLVLCSKYNSSCMITPLVLPLSIQYLDLLAHLVQCNVLSVTVCEAQYNVYFFCS